MNKVMDLRQSSEPVDNRCQVRCRNRANQLLDCNDSELLRWQTQSGKVHYIWSSAKYDWLLLCRAFVEDTEFWEDNLLEIKQRRMVVADQDIFLFGGQFYYLEQTKTNFVIRRLFAYCSQSIVEAMIKERNPDFVIESIYLANFYFAKPHRLEYVMTCWGVISDNDSLFYIPVFDEDRHWFDEYETTAFVISEIDENTIFRKGKFSYKMFFDENNKIGLLKNSAPYIIPKKEFSISSAVIIPFKSRGV